MGSKRKWEVPSRHTVWEFDEDAPVGAEAEATLSEQGAEEIAAELLDHVTLSAARWVRSVWAVGMVRTACFSRVACFGEW